MESHCLCEFDQKQPEQNCFFCHMRSSCLRLNTTRTKGPRSLKLVEFTSHLFNYETLGWNWRENCADLVGFIGNTLKLLRRNDNSISSFLGFPDGQCQHCQMSVKIKRKYIYQVQTGEIAKGSKEIRIKDILHTLVSENLNKPCCLESIELEKSDKYVIF